MASIFRSSSPTALLQLFVLIAVFGSLLAQTVPDYLPLRSFVLTVAVLFWIQLVAWATWRVILYPKFFSPLRHLPHPSVSNTGLPGEASAMYNHLLILQIIR